MSKPSFALASPAGLLLALACAPQAPSDAQDQAALEGTETVQIEESDGSIQPWLAWPFDQRTSPAKIYQTYGQGERMLPKQLHMGLDLAVASGTRVYSPVTGEVSMSFRAPDYPPHQQGIAISTSHKNVEVFIKLLHLERSTIQFAIGDQVRRGDYLGNVHPWPRDPNDINTYGDYETHLHIEMGLGSIYVAGGEQGPRLQLQPGDRFEPNSNPLLHLEVPEPDQVSPSLHPIGDPGPFEFRPPLQDDRANLDPAADPGAGSPPQALDPASLSGEVDVLFAISDGYSLDQPSVIAPLVITVLIEDLGPAPKDPIRRTLELRGQLDRGSDGAHRINLDPADRFAEHSAFLYHLTAVRPYGPETPTEAWDTSQSNPGPHRVTVLVSDTHHKAVPLGSQLVQVSQR